MSYLMLIYDNCMMIIVSNNAEKYEKPDFSADKAISTYSYIIYTFHAFASFIRRLQRVKILPINIKIQINYEYEYYKNYFNYAFNNLNTRIRVTCVLY